MALACHFARQRVKGLQNLDVCIFDSFCSIEQLFWPFKRAGSLLSDKGNHKIGWKMLHVSVGRAGYVSADSLGCLSNYCLPYFCACMLAGIHVVELFFVGCLTSQKHVSVSQGRICSDNFTCCYTEIEVADLTLHLTQSQYNDTGPTSPSTYPITPGAWQGSYWSVNF